MAKRLGTLLSGLLECGAFCGIIFGWASLVFVLKDLGYFKDLCQPTTNTTPSPNHSLLLGRVPVPWPLLATIPIPVVALAPLSPCLMSPVCLCPGVPMARGAPCPHCPVPCGAPGPHCPSPWVPHVPTAC